MEVFMRIQVSSRPVSRSILFLLPVVIGLAALSWRLAGPGPSTILSNTEDYLANGFSRTGTSTDRLVESLQKRLQNAPDDWQGYSQLGLAYLQKARETGDPSFYQKSEQAFQKVLALEPEDYASTGAMGTLALARHQFHTALEWGQRALEINPDRAYAYGVVADAQIELGLYEDAVQTLQKMVDLRPDMSSYARISYVRELYGDVDGAIEMMQRAVDAGVPNSENTAWTRTQLANLYFNLGRLRDAEREYNLTLYGYPHYEYALAGLGRVRAAQGRMDEAVALLDQASARVPNPEFLIALGDLYQVSGQVEASQKQHDLLGVIQKLHEANGVDMDLEIALFNADHDVDLVSTIEQARRAYERRPSVYAEDVLAWVLFKTGDYKEAQALSEQALRLGTKDALKLFHAGMISHRLGENAKALDYLERALEINPHFSILYAQEAQRTLDELRASP
jgi:tetratricopeptide (TPR) repeat protein